MLSTKTVRLLRAVQRRIKKRPKKYDQSQSGDENTCGSPMCIMGHAISIVANRLPASERHALWTAYDRSRRRSRLVLRALGVDYDQFRRLFLSNAWPGEFYRWSNVEVTPGLAIRRIDHFIKTGGEE